MSDRHAAEPCPLTEVEVDGEPRLIDGGVAELVRVLNRLPGVRTISSCEGHPHSVHDPRAYVLVEWADIDVELRVWPDDVERFGAAIARLADSRRLDQAARSSGSEVSGQRST